MTIKEYIDRISNINAADIGKKTGNMVLASWIGHTRPLTPWRTGHLRRNWRGNVDSEPGKTTITLTNPVFYASYMNDGHRIVTRSGHVVGWYEGFHMVEKGRPKEKFIHEALRRELEAAYHSEVD